MAQNLSWKSTSFSSSQAVFACYDTENVIISDITSRLSIFSFRWTYFTPSYPISLRLRLISSYRFRSRNGLPPMPGPRSNVFPPEFPTRIPCTSLLHVLNVIPFSPSFILLTCDKEYELWSTSFWTGFYLLVASSPLFPNVLKKLLIVLFSTNVSQAHPFQ